MRNFLKDVSNEWGTSKMKGYFNGAVHADLDTDSKPDFFINPLKAAAMI